VTNFDWVQEEHASRRNAVQCVYSAVHIEVDMRREMRMVLSLFCFCMASEG
jgi:hypothetical protein